MNIKKYLYLTFIFCGTTLAQPKDDFTHLDTESFNNAAQYTNKLMQSEVAEIPAVTGITLGLDKGVLEIVNAIRKLLADNFVLYTKTLNFHWNVEGELFSQLHEFFKKLYEDLQDTNDLLAERIRALGSYSPGSLTEFLVLTQLQENNGKALPYRQMLEIVLDDFEIIIRSLRTATELTAKYNDWGSNNMLAGLLEKQEKNAWMVRAHLAGKK